MEKLIFDSHAHYFDGRFVKGINGGADALLKQLFDSSVGYIINVGTNCNTSRLALEQAAKYDGMYAAVGIHPEDCHYVQDADASLKELWRLLGTEETRRRDKIVALGEIGLDYHYENYGEIPMDKQKQAYFFEEQMKIAQALALPVIIHDREAHGDCFDMILKFPKVKGVFHSYSGSPEMAKELVKRGWYISFSGTLTFKNANRVRECALSIPRERLLVETDAPYLAPHPHRGELNHSGMLEYTLQSLAQLWGIEQKETLKITYQNAKKLFQIQ